MFLVGRYTHKETCDYLFMITVHLPGDAMLSCCVYINLIICNDLAYDLYSDVILSYINVKTSVRSLQN